MTSAPSSQFHVFKSEVSVFTRLFFSGWQTHHAGFFKLLASHGKPNKIVTTLTSILLSLGLRKSEVEERGKRAVIWARSRVTENPFATLFFELASC